MENIYLNDILFQFSLGLDAVEAEITNAAKFHGKRIAVLCAAMGEYLGMSSERIFALSGCALLHDNALTEYILSERPGKMQTLNLKSHCIAGQKNLRFFPFHYNIDGFVLYHHECTDGSGPFGRKSSEYPLEAALIAISDKIDVRFNLGIGSAGKRDRILEYIKSNPNIFATTEADAFSAVFTEDFAKQLHNENIDNTAAAKFKDDIQPLSVKEIIGISKMTAKIIDYKSEFTRVHTTQIANKAWYMAQSYGYDKDSCAQIYLAAALHDFGKLFISSEVLEKPGRLTDEEFEIIKSHAKITWECIHNIRGFEKIALWASNHHEKLDGSGYPFGKTAEQLDFVSRLLACLDIYQAVREKRPYHKERSHREAMNILNDMADKGFIDKEISKDCGERLALLPDGCAPEP